MEDLFSQIKPLKVSKEVANQIRGLIKDGKLQPGDKLPPERNLAAFLGVGRSSLREAINSLETMGFVETKKRKGIFVRSVSEPILSNPLRNLIKEDKRKLFQLYEIRKDIELASATLAARRRTVEDLARIQGYINKMVFDARRGHMSTSDDIGFHVAIAQATHNVIRVHILKNIFELFNEFIDRVVEMVAKEKDDMLHNIDLHQQIYNAIERGDSEHARKTMKELLVWIEKNWQHADNAGW
ncbi:MAG: FadR family transcriptional regulator [Deltaproteobacteria bacterium]|nr:FadR family transcriptional regulator [Deltaproteobacteria bacterium]